MKAKLNGKTKILTAAVLCACTTLWANSVWAANGGIEHSDGAYYGGRNTSANGVVENKNVTIEAGDSFKGVYGGYSFEEKWDDPVLTGSSQANKNTVTINGANITGGTISLGWSKYDAVVAGGWANYTSDNTVNINGGEIKTSVYGGYSMVSENQNQNHPKINGNVVNVNNDTIIRGNIYGAYVTSKRDDDNKNILSNNKVVINSGTIICNDNNDYGNIFGACSEDKNSILNNNKVVINGGYIKTANSNDEDGIFGALATSENNTANYNIVEINGGKIEGNIYGAKAYTGYPNNEVKGEISYNQVNIKGGEIIGDIYAGKSQQGTLQYYNSINLSGNKANLS